MDDENGLELSLGLSLGGSKSNPKKSPDISPNPKPDEGSSSRSCTPISAEFSFTNLFQNNSKQTHELVSDEVNIPKKHKGGEGPNSLIIDLTKSSHLSINTGDGSVGENDDVAESDSTDGSNYKPSDNKGGASASATATGVTVTRFPSGLPISFHTVNNDNNNNMLVSARDRQLAFGYNSMQIPTLETNPVWPYRTNMEEDERKSQGSVQASYTSSQAVAFDKKPQEPNREAASSSSLNPDTKPNPNPNPNTNHKKPQENPNLQENKGPIRRGIGSEIKFGGSGSCPELPWVTTNGSGPHGKTISGVTYRFGPGKEQLRIVCACHGTHMSPEEFVHHASADVANMEINGNNINNNIMNINPSPASAQN